MINSTYFDVQNIDDFRIVINDDPLIFDRKDQYKFIYNKVYFEE